MTTENSTYGLITQEGIDRMRGRLGVYYHGVRHVGEITADAIRTYAQGMGERNPLFFDEDCGRESLHGSIIATPHFPVDGAGSYRHQLGWIARRAQLLRR